MKPVVTKTLVRALWSALVAVGLAAALPATPAKAVCPPCYNFLTIDNSAGPNFNQLLGINDESIMAGYYGDGTVQPSHVLVPVDHFASENFPESTQTQVAGINSEKIPVTVGSWTDSKGNVSGFVNVNGVFTNVVFRGDPPGEQASVLLGVNDTGDAVGFQFNQNRGPKDISTISPPKPLPG